MNRKPASVTRLHAPEGDGGPARAAAIDGTLTPVLPAGVLSTTTGFEPPPLFDDYRVVQPLGTGGMGSVYLAHDTVLDRPVAVKFIQVSRPNARLRAQFFVEARAAARIQHPSVVTIHRVGELEGRPYIVSELLRGCNLGDLDLPLPSGRVLEIAVAIARGLAAAHRYGVLHLDIKPSNVFLTLDGDVKLLDFGLARLVETKAARDEEPPAGAAAPPAMAAAAAASKPPTGEVILEGPGSSHEGALVGTPAYLPPELWRHAAPTRRSDIYSTGALLYELCTGRPPYGHGAPLELRARALAGPPPPVASVVPPTTAEAPTTLTTAPTPTTPTLIDPQLGAIIDRCLRPDPADRFASGDELRLALEKLAHAPGEPRAAEGNPYRGLLPFEPEHRALFFGRGQEIGAVIDRLRTRPFVLITGESGSGKSSLCAAGVLPQVGDGALGGGRSWAVARLAPGQRPLQALAGALAPHLGGRAETLAEALRDDPAWLARQLVDRAQDGRGLLVFVDQLEELVTIADPDEAIAFAAALGRLLAPVPGARLLLAVRGDYLGRVIAIPTFGEDLAHELYFLPPLGPDRLREAIVGPAAARGVRFESEALVDALVTSTANAPGGLPLLQFALAELWEARPPGADRITRAALESIGGVEGAMSRHADHMLLGMLREARRLLAAFATTNVGADAGTPRLRRSEEELVGDNPQARAALAALVRGRLLVAREGEGGTVYEVAHEALLRRWETLRQVLAEQADELAVRQRLAAAAVEWERLGRSREALYRGRVLEEAALLDATQLEPRERAFLAASRGALARRRLLQVAAAATTVLAIAVGFTASEMRSRRAIDSRVSDRLASAAADLSVADARRHQVTDTRRRALAAFETGHAADGERLWSAAAAMAEDVERGARHATQKLEAALLVDTSRADVREQLARQLYERAIDAEREHRPGLREDLVERLATWDPTGAWAGRLNAPAHLSLRTTPAGATAVIQQQRRADDDTIEHDAPTPLGATPLASIALAPGSYLILMSAPGRVTVRLPILARRGEQLDLAIDLPPAEVVPAGFVYVPPGRFLFGSADDDTVRKGFLRAVPLHEVSTGAFLIARYETTFADWIEYERSLPATRRAHALRAGNGPFDGALQLDQLPDGTWRLRMQLATNSYEARAGEPVRYRARRAGAVQDWLRMPAAGMTRDEAVAYTRWLAATGRVPGARLCTEYEWERAARGADYRVFPHGWALRPDDANFDETHGRDFAAMGPDEVGSHPRSASPFGVEDLAGNVFEWVTSSLDPSESLLRGGAWFYDATTNRSDNRNVVEAGSRDPKLGLRVCADVRPAS